jgi:hypothetical protein
MAARRRNKRIQIPKEVFKFFLLADNMILHKKRSEKFLDTKNSFNKVLGYKINLQKSVAFLYTNNEQNEKEYRKIIPFTIVSKST